MGIVDDLKIIKKGFKFKWFYERADSTDIGNIEDYPLIPPKIIELLIKRGVKSNKDIEVFLESPLSSFLNPFELKDTDKAVRKLYSSLLKDEKICVYGDYDVDGITATAVLYLFLKEIGANVIYYIPDNVSEGYSLNKKAIKNLSDNNVKLLITVDCGINSISEVIMANSIGVDVIITDHHEPRDELPVHAAAIINPYRSDCTYPFKGLSGVGVVYKLMMAIKFYLEKKDYFLKKGNNPNMFKYLDLVTLGTIADVSPLISENRVIVKHGLNIIGGHQTRVGIEELKKITGLTNKKIGVNHIGFILNPRINAVARFGKSLKGVKLLTTNDVVEAVRLSEELNAENKIRQDLEKKILKETIEQIEEQDLPKKNKAFVLYSKYWHPSIMGIIASRIVDQYYRPAIIISFDGKIGKGSARSQPTFNLYKGIKSLSKLLTEYGGHRNAVGLRILYENIHLFQHEFNRLVEKELDVDDLCPEIIIDAVVDSNDINKDLVNWIKQLEPFGTCNSEPNFLMENVKILSAPTFGGKNKNILKCFVKKDSRVFELIGYKMNEYKFYLEEGKLYDVVFTPEKNLWSDDIYLKVKDFRKAD
mgnify:CR=1 FL=1|jgi:single-stranded-DNA-specific exonuclease